MLQGNDVLSSANTIAGIVYQKREDVAYYFGLRRMNDSLINENTRLRLLKLVKTRYFIATSAVLILKRRWHLSSMVLPKK